MNFQNYACKDLNFAQIYPVESPEDKTPVILIHGCQVWPVQQQTCSDFYLVQSFQELQQYLESKSDISSYFKFYQFQYPTFYSPDLTAGLLRDRIDQIMPNQEDIVFICHTIPDKVSFYIQDISYG